MVEKTQVDPQGCVYKLEQDYSYTRVTNCQCEFGFTLKEGNKHPRIIVLSDTLYRVEYFRNY
jgi:hypothetical protein